MAVPPLAVAEEGTKTSTVKEGVKKADPEVGGTSLGGLMREAAARKSFLRAVFSDTVKTCQIGKFSEIFSLDFQALPKTCQMKI